MFINMQVAVNTARENRFSVNKKLKQFGLVLLLEIGLVLFGVFIGNTPYDTDYKSVSVDIHLEAHSEEQQVESYQTTQPVALR